MTEQDKLIDELAAEYGVPREAVAELIELWTKKLVASLEQQFLKWAEETGVEGGLLHAGGTINPVQFSVPPQNEFVVPFKFGIPKLF